jgi:hypothetical protein
MLLIEVVLGCVVPSRSSFYVHSWITNSCFMWLVNLDHALFATIIVVFVVPQTKSAAIF